MKKLLIAFCAVLLLTACTTKEQTGLKESLVAKLKDDPDLKDYKLDPEPIADCVVREIGETMPGFAGDPRRVKFFEAYNRFVNVKSAHEAEQSIADYQQLFGSAKQAREAATNITNHLMTCMGLAIEKATPDTGE